MRVGIVADVASLMRVQAESPSRRCCSRLVARPARAIAPAMHDAAVVHHRDVSPSACATRKFCSTSRMVVPARLSSRRPRSRRRRSPAQGPWSARRSAAAGAARRWRARSPASASARPRACRRASSQNLFSAGKKPKIQSSRVSSSGRVARREHHVLLHREVGEDPHVLRHVGDAGARDVGRRQPSRCRVPSKRISPARRAPQAHDGAQRRGLAGAVAAEQHRQSALAAPRSRRRAGCDSARYACARRRA